MNLERTFDGARQLLSALANIPNVRDHDQAACAALKSIGRGLPMYDYISLRRLDGTLECGSIESRLNIRADPWLIDKATASGEFVIGFYGRSLVTGNQVLRLSYPVLDRDGCGMDAATRQRIFEPFFTMEEAPTPRRPRRPDAAWAHRARRVALGFG